MFTMNALIQHVFTAILINFTIFIEYSYALELC